MPNLVKTESLIEADTIVESTDDSEKLGSESTQEPTLPRNDDAGRQELIRRLSAAAMDLTCSAQYQCEFIEFPTGPCDAGYVPFSNKTTSRSALDKIVADSGTFEHATACPAIGTFVPAKPVCVASRCVFPDTIDDGHLNGKKYCSEYGSGGLVVAPDSLFVTRTEVEFAADGRFTFVTDDTVEEGDYFVDHNSNRDGIVARTPNTRDSMRGYLSGDVLLWDGVAYSEAACRKVNPNRGESR